MTDHRTRKIGLSCGEEFNHPNVTDRQTDRIAISVSCGNVLTYDSELCISAGASDIVLVCGRGMQSQHTLWFIR